MVEHKVIVTTSGFGSRLKNLTKYTNKSLIQIGSKPAIAHIIDQYPPDTEFIITLGHFGNQVKQFLEIAYTNKKFTFVEIDNFDKPGSSLAYSLLQTKHLINQPFIFHSCDTLVSDAIGTPDFNWLGINFCNKSNDYATVSLDETKISKIFDKGQEYYDAIYIGLAGIKDFELFFKELENGYKLNQNNNQLSDVFAIRKMMQQLSFGYKTFDSWLDIGNIDGLKQAREKHKCNKHILLKEEESIFFINNNVIKFFHNTDIVKNRLHRSKTLGNLVPNINQHTDNFYSYPYINGITLSECINEQLVEKVLVWAQENLWIQTKTPNNFYETCEKFYFNKTIQRIKSLLSKHSICSEETKTINNITVPTVEEMLSSIDKNWLCNIESYQFHGDFISENILVCDDSFKLIDWRQDFGNDLENGDRYYDLAKFNHNLHFNHKIINNNGFEFLHKNDNSIYVDLMLTYNMNLYRSVFSNFVNENNLDLKKINFLTGLIWVNMSALHPYPLDKFLYYFGRLHMYLALNTELPAK